jgi:hypothetical protein
MLVITLACYASLSTVIYGTTLWVIFRTIDEDLCDRAEVDVVQILRKRFGDQETIIEARNRYNRSHEARYDGDAK